MQNSIIKFWLDQGDSGVKEIKCRDKTFLIPDYYFAMNDGDECVMMYAEGENISFSGIMEEELGDVEIDELVSLLSQTSAEEIAKAYVDGDENENAESLVLLDNENAYIVRIDVEGETDIYEGITVSHETIYVVVDLSGQQLFLAFLGYEGEKPFINDYDKALMLTYGMDSDTDATTDPTKDETPSIEQSGATDTDSSSPDGVTPELKEFLDSYESFMNEYCDFFENYDPSDISALTKYFTMLQKYAEFAEKAEEYDSDDMSAADAAYYLEVTTRILQRIQNIGG